MKILFVTTLSGTVNAFLVPHINILIDKGYKIDIACNVGRPIPSQLIERGCRIFNFEFNRFPMGKENYSAYRKLVNLIQNESYNLIHTHTPVASVLTRIACKSVSDVKVYYTAHGFHFFKGAPLINWLLYYPIEWWLSRYTDLLITINCEDFNIAKNKFRAKKVEYIPGVGFDTKKFSTVQVNKSIKRSEIGIPQNGIFILSVGEINKNKNHETVIKAIAKLNNVNIYYVICGHGPLENYLKGLIRKLDLENQVHLLGYRTDIAEICKSADIFAFPSKREGLGMAALEAMASGLPIVTSNVHGILDYSINNETGYACSPTDVDGFAKAIEQLAKNKELRVKMGVHNSRVVKKFDLNNVKRIIKHIYDL